MPRNIEIKARVTDPAVVRTAALSLASSPGVLIEQTDTFFVVSKGRLKIRAFADGSGELIAYDRPDDTGPKQSVYTRVACDDAAELARALASVLTVRGHVRKRRELFIVGRTRVHLDDVERLGAFVELEVVLQEDEPAEGGRREAEALMDALGIPPSALVSGAYIDLLERSAG
jgi:predicted adenylyl cyclase CyaB